jgi:hypothetical protein
MAHDPRFDDTLTKLLGTGDSLPVNWDWQNTQTWYASEAKKQLLEKITQELKRRVFLFIHG